MTHEEILRQHGQRVEEELGRVLPSEERPPARLHQAMRYTLLAPGKRVRPILTLLCGEMQGAPPGPLLHAACAVEMVHASSLILDDLPCMDDAARRRGRETNHRVFGESTAILAALGLLNAAFGLLARLRDEGIHAEVAAEAGSVLAESIGSSGLIAGQTVDLALGRTSVDLATLEFIHAHKTGSLFIASADLGALLGGAGLRERAALRRFAKNLGLAFQITDDLLDATGDAATLGKDVRKDAGRTTFVTLCGAAEAKALSDELIDHAVEALEPLGRRATPLRDLAQRIRTRAS